MDLFTADSDPTEQGQPGESSAPIGTDAGTDRDTLPDDQTIDYITDDPVKDTPKEQVRQRIVRALLHEYGISLDDMARDFPVPVSTQDGRRRARRADIAIFAHGSAHGLANLRRVVICKPEPKNGKTRIRTHDQATRDLEELTDLMGDDLTPQVAYGLWTNGLDLFFVHKEISRFGSSFEPRADWPQADESLGSRTVASHARLRRGDADMLKTTFRRCHNFIHGNEGMPKDAAFWQFLYLLFAKMHDERVSAQGGAARFFAGLDEPFTADGRKRIRQRVDRLFDEVKEEYPLFGARDEIALSDRALAFLVGELAPYDLRGTDLDVKGMAYQELVGANLRGDRGQYFTPRGAVTLMVDILDPGEGDTVFDPACGTGGFLRETLRHLLDGWREREGTRGRPDTDAQLDAHRERLAAYAHEHLFGADFDQFLVRTTSMNVMLLAGIEGNIYHMDSLAFPGGHQPGVIAARKRVTLGSVDVLMTNPPFGTDIKITDRDILDHYRNGVAQSWSRSRDTGLLVASGTTPATAVAPEQLFIQRAVEWVKPGGRVGIVLPNGILSNPGPSDQAIREWILRHCWVLASVELPVETFIVDAGVNILTTLLFLKKKTEEEQMTETMGGAQDYPVFMAVAEKVGVDRRGNPVYKRRPDGEVILEVTETVERIRIGGREEERTLRRKRSVVDDDLPEIGKAYKRFRAVHHEPGLPRTSSP
ncbi:MAG TPA: N-6 DNA methylase [Mycobacteriales bacterium]|nr:N-6 DNA methylase [Mycobacteriales bacterium]